MKKALLTSVATLFLATGIASAQPTWTQEESKSGIRKYEFTRHVFSGITSTVALYFSLTQNCDPRPANEMQIMKEPEHGTVELLIGEEATVNLTKEHDRSHCNGKKRPGTLIKYISKDGYVGPDGYVMLEFLPGGMVVETTMHIIVYARKANRSSK